MNTISELHVLIDWTCHFTKLENKSDKVTAFPSPIYTPTKE